jgi:L-asparaginase II
MSELRIESTRSGIIESVHRVSVAIVTPDARLVASSGDPQLVTVTRSTVKPFQALPLVQDGVVDRFSITSQELALACASHNSEQDQVAIVAEFLRRIGCAESDLACGPHRALGATYSVPPLDPELLAPAAPLSSNCSGKHTGMLALARHHDWETEGYQASGHPVQQRIKRELARWSGLSESAIREGIDGCTAVTFALPLFNLALAMARLVAGEGVAERTVVSAMVEHPHLVAGTARLATDLMLAYPGQLVAKVGAEGLYLAALLDRGLGIALKVEDGDAMSAMVALVAVLDQLELDPAPSSVVPQFAELPVHNTRGIAVGAVGPTGGVSFVGLSRRGID